MSVSIKIDPISHKNLNKRFEVLGKAYPEETFRAIVKILFDMKRLAQVKIKQDGHIVTSRLRNSIFVKTPNQKYASRAGNQKNYSDNEGNTFNGDLNINLKDFEGAFGTNVVYAKFIERMDSFIEWAVRNVDVNKRFREIPTQANKRR